MRPQMFQESYARVFDGNATWNALLRSGGFVRLDVATALARLGDTDGLVVLRQVAEAGPPAQQKRARELLAGLPAAVAGGAGAR